MQAKPEWNFEVFDPHADIEKASAAKKAVE
jgi:hypothetical protein